MDKLFQRNDDNFVREILTHAQVIAVVGHSEKAERDSYRVAQFLRTAGYRVYPVNPNVKKINGQLSYPTLKEIPEPVDIVNVFRRSEYLSEIVDEAIAINAKTLWAQLGIFDRQAAQKAVDAGLKVIMDACIQLEYLRLKIS
jgi:predicted CoA-binding protein